MRTAAQVFLFICITAVLAYESYLPQKTWNDCPEADAIYQQMVEMDSVVEEKSSYVTEVVQPNYKVLKEFRSELQTTYQNSLQWDSSSGHLQEQVRNKQVSQSTSLNMEFVDAERWKVTGLTIKDLTSSKNYPDSPDDSGTLTSLSGPTNWYEAYGQRIRGYLVPKTSGQYNFWIAADDEAELYLSTDGSAANKKQIAYIRKLTSYGNWNSAASQKSAEIQLQANIPYYIEILHLDQGSTDHVEVAWQGPGISQQIVSKDYLAGYFSNKKTVEASLDLSSHDNLRKTAELLIAEEQAQILYAALGNLNDNCNTSNCLNTYQLIMNSTDLLVNCYEQEINSLPTITNNTYVDTMRTTNEQLKYAVDKCKNDICPSNAFASFNYQKSCEDECKDGQAESQYEGDTTCEAGTRCYTGNGKGTIKSKSGEEIYIYTLYSLLKPNYNSYQQEAKSSKTKMISLPYGNLYVQSSSSSQYGSFLYELEGVTLSIGNIQNLWNEVWIIFNSKTSQLTTQVNGKRKDENVTKWSSQGKGVDFSNLGLRQNVYTFYGSLPFCYQNKILYTENKTEMTSPEVFNTSTPVQQPNGTCYTSFSSKDGLSIQSKTCENVEVEPGDDLPVPTDDKLCLNKTQSVTYNISPFVASDYTFFVTFRVEMLTSTEVVVLPEQVSIHIQKDEDDEDYQVVLSNEQETFSVGLLDKVEWNSVLIAYTLSTQTYVVTLNSNKPNTIKFQKSVKLETRSFILKAPQVCFKNLMYTPVIVNDTTPFEDNPDQPYEPEVPKEKCEKVSDCKKEMIGDGVCQPECEIAECYYDENDCLTPNSTHCAIDCTWNQVGDRVCQDACDNEACNNDCQDCMFPNEVFCSMNCSWGMLNNGECEEECNNEVCSYDGFDCKYPNLNKCSESCYVRQIGNSYCNQECNTLDCQYDGGDCIYPNKYYCAEGCLWDWLNDGICEPECKSVSCNQDLPDCSETCQQECSAGCCVTQLGDGVCQNACNNEQCLFDHEDCTSCSEGCTWSSVGDGKCDSQCNNEFCQYDGGDCDKPPVALPCGETCNQGTIGDGICNLECNIEECEYDKGDCTFPNNNFCWLGCQNSWINNGVCEPSCQNQQCNFDGEDCTPDETSVIFSDDFESGNLGQWFGKDNQAHSGVLVRDPLNPDNTVLTLSEVRQDGDIFTPQLDSPTNSYVICFNYLAMPKEYNNLDRVGGSVGVGNKEEQVWLASTDDNINTVNLKPLELSVSTSWQKYCLAFTDASAPGTLSVVLQDSESPQSDVYFDDISIIAIDSEKSIVDQISEIASAKLLFSEDFEADLTTNWQEQTKEEFVSSIVPDSKDKTNNVLQIQSSDELYSQPFSSPTDQYILTFKYLGVPDGRVESGGQIGYCQEDESGDVTNPFYIASTTTFEQFDQLAFTIPDTNQWKTVIIAFSDNFKQSNQDIDLIIRDFVGENYNNVYFDDIQVYSVLPEKSKAEQSKQDEVKKLLEYNQTFAGLSQEYLEYPNEKFCAEGCPHNWFNDGVCNPPCQVADCFFDRFDCATTEQCAPGCNKNQLGNKVCESACNVPSCNYDNDDCKYCSQGCSMSMINDGVCQNECFVEHCKMDGSDCYEVVKDYCSEGCSSDMLGNGVCDQGCFNKQCQYDHNDCLDYCSEKCLKQSLGNGLCNVECYSEQCSFDLGDCDACNTGCSSCQLANMQCDQSCDTEACQFDGGDCVEACNDLGCKISQIGNGICNPECQTLSCQFDGTDCWGDEECSYGCSNNMVNDGTCQLQCWNQQCDFDGKDCTNPYCSEGCLESQIDNGICEEVCFNEDCKLDGSDCQPPKECADGCSYTDLNDGICQQACQVESCDFDENDCKPETSCAKDCLLRQVGDGICDQTCNNEQCYYDSGDCDEPDYCNDECKIDLINNGNCDPQCLTESCQFDGFDCDVCTRQGCVAAFKGDGICNQICNTAECNYDNGDCEPWCASQCNPQFINDGVCDQECYLEQCDFDGNDCTDRCSWNCLNSWIGDGECNGVCNNEECNNDGGDCTQECSLECFGKMQNGKCDEECKTPECDYDGRDCEAQCQLGCFQSMIGNGFCNSVCMNQNCNFDGGDCTDRCTYDCLNQNLGDGVCQPECNVEECDFDDGDCTINTCAEDCITSDLGNKVCDMHCNFVECNWDDGDCVPDGHPTPFCNKSQIGDGVCQNDCYNEQANFDGGDCEEQPDCQCSDELLENGICNRECNNYECSFDLGDCTKCNCPFAWLGDLKCDQECNIPECNYDNGDCPPDTPIDDKIYCTTSCKWDDIGNGVCDPACNISLCYYDKGDCVQDYLPNTTHCAEQCRWNDLGNNKCDVYCNNLACVYDMGDCEPFNEQKCAENCLWEQVGDGICNQECNIPQCNQDESDCDNKCFKIVPECIHLLANGFCDSQCDIEECGWDQGDCIYPNDRYCDKGCLWSMIGDGISQPACVESKACGNDAEDNTITTECEEGCSYNQLGNGVCDESCNNEDCYWDEGDCSACADGCAWSQVGDGNCQQSCNVETCWYDKYDCIIPPEPKGVCGDEDCSIQFLGNGECNPECNNLDCNFDGGDCVYPSEPYCNRGCTYSMINDGTCQQACQNELCSWDGNDCNNYCADKCAPSQLGNGKCDEECNVEECGFDQGECDFPGPLYCNEECRWEWVGDRVCDKKCNTEECYFDSGDCELKEECSEGCLWSQIGDGECQEECLTENCHHDGSDCETCGDKGCGISWIGDKHCDPECEVPECFNDANDCVNLPIEPCADGCEEYMVGDGACQEECFVPQCQNDKDDCQNYCEYDCQKVFIGDQVCDIDCYNEACQWDGGDCDQCGSGCAPGMIGNLKCDQACNTTECSFDGGDCIEECSPGCFQNYIGDGSCDIECWNQNCSYDGNDCFVVNECAPDCQQNQINNGQCEQECFNAQCDWDGNDCSGDLCSAGCQTEMIGNGVCDTACLTQPCCYDGDDCYKQPTCADSCPVCWLADGKCDEACNVLSCSYDGGDCAPPEDSCAPGCYNYMVGDGICQDECNVEACNHDVNDCQPEQECSPDCSISMINNGKCDAICLNEACNFDGNDCDKCTKAGCPQGFNGDGLCDQECNIKECDFDSGDCPLDCNQGCTTDLINDGMCQKECYVKECDYDGEDCNHLSGWGCPLSWLGDGECDKSCYNPECLFDNGDCDNTENCDKSCKQEMINNGLCEEKCNNEACNWDGFDCLPRCSEHCLQEQVSDGHCDYECFNQACKYDGADCSSKCAWECTTSMIGDGKCQSECFNSRCMFDAGDCIQSNCAKDCFISWLGDGYCDLSCNTPACTWDKSDCLQEGYCAPECKKTMINNGVCESECQYDSCSNDGIDCKTQDECSSGCFQDMLGDGVCHKACNNKNCNWDNNDCVGCPLNCTMDFNCDQQCNIPECNYDYTDCLPTFQKCPITCPRSYIGDGRCNIECLLEACRWDGGDCSNGMSIVSICYGSFNQNLKLQGCDLETSKQGDVQFNSNGELILNDKGLVNYKLKKAPTKSNSLAISLALKIAQQKIVQTFTKQTSITIGQADVERWFDIPGLSVKDLTNSLKYPNNPDQRTVISSLSSAEVGENYGQRIYGYIVPKQTGKYTFWITSDEHSEFWLSKDGDSDNKVMIAQYRSWTTVGDPNKFDKNPDQKSKDIYLEQGKPYYFEILHKENQEGDHVSVAWKGPGIPQREVVSSEYLGGYNANCDYVKSQRSSADPNLLYPVVSTLIGNLSVKYNQKDLSYYFTPLKGSNFNLKSANYDTWNSFVLLYNDQTGETNVFLDDSQQKYTQPIPVEDFNANLVLFAGYYNGNAFNDLVVSNYPFQKSNFDSQVQQMKQTQESIKTTPKVSSQAAQKTLTSKAQAPAEETNAYQKQNQQKVDQEAQNEQNKQQLKNKTPKGTSSTWPLLSDTNEASGNNAKVTTKGTGKKAFKDQSLNLVDITTVFQRNDFQNSNYNFKIDYQFKQITQKDTGKTVLVQLPTHKISLDTQGNVYLENDSSSQKIAAKPLTIGQWYTLNITTDGDSVLIQITQINTQSTQEGFASLRGSNPSDTIQLYGNQDNLFKNMVYQQLEKTAQVTTQEQNQDQGDLDEGDVEESDADENQKSLNLNDVIGDGNTFIYDVQDDDLDQQDADGATEVQGQDLGKSVDQYYEEKNQQEVNQTQLDNTATKTKKQVLVQSKKIEDSDDKGEENNSLESENNQESEQAIQQVDLTTEQQSVEQQQTQEQVPQEITPQEQQIESIENFRTTLGLETVLPIEENVYENNQDQNGLDSDQVNNQDAFDFENEGAIGEPISIENESDEVESLDLGSVPGVGNLEQQLPVILQQDQQDQKGFSQVKKTKGRKQE